MKDKLRNVIAFAEQIRSLAIKMTDFKKVKVIESDIVLLYDKELKVGGNIWASLAWESDDTSEKMQLPIGEYKLSNDKTIVVNPEGTIEAIKYSLTNDEELRAFIRSKSIK